MCSASHPSFAATVVATEMVKFTIRKLPQSDKAGLIISGDTMSDAGIAGGRIRSFVERIEQVEAEIAELNEGKKEIFAEAKGEGFDVKVIKEIIKLRKQDQNERDEHETLLDLYMRAMDNAQTSDEAKAA
jgi:uncharacterized protein (UPF0335 family)